MSFQRETYSDNVRRRRPSLARRSELENSPPYGKTSSSTLRSLPYHQEIITRHLPDKPPRSNEDPPGLSHRPSNEVSGNRCTQTQLQKTFTGNHRRRTVTIQGLLYAKEMTFRERMARLQFSVTSPMDQCGQMQSTM